MPNLPIEDERVDNDGWPVDRIREYYGEHYGELTDDEIEVLLNVHDHSRCATGIWLQVGLDDMMRFLHHCTTKRELEARIDELEKLQMQSTYILKAHTKLDRVVLTRRNQLIAELKAQKEQEATNSEKDTL